MKKVLMNTVSVILTGFFAAALFYCFVAGACIENDVEAYVTAAAGLSVLLSVALCICIRTVLCLAKKLRDLEMRGTGEGDA